MTVAAGGTIDAHGSAATVVFAGSTVNNAGTIIADNAGGVVFEAAVTATQVIGDVVDNSGQMIATSGGGMLIELTQLSNEASGVIRADSGSTIAIVNSIVEKNLGTFEANSGGTIGIQNSTINNAGGTITLISTGTIDLLNSIVTGGAVSNAGLIDIQGSSLLEGNLTVTGGQLTIESGQTLQLDDVTLSGVAVTVNSDGTTPSIQIDAGQTFTWAGASSFGGSGAVIIDDNGHIVHTGTLSQGFSQTTFEGTGTDTQNGGNMGTVPQTLINESVTFDGFTQMGSGHAGSLTLTNQAAGTYDADNSAHAFIFDTGNTITNAGLFEATGGATLEIESTVNNNRTTVNNAGGNVTAGANSEVELLNATVNGGTVSTAATGTLVGNGASAIDNAIINNTGTIETGGTFTLDGDTINGGTLTGIAAGAIYNVDSGKTLTLNGITALGSVSGATGTLDNAGTVTLENTLTLGGTNFTLALDGAGAVGLNGATVAGSGTYTQALLNDGNTIVGSGTIEDLAITNENGGAIGAEHTPGDALTIEFVSLTNDSGGSIYATSHGMVTIEDAGVTNESGGSIDTVNSGTINIDSATVTNAAGGNITADNTSTIAFLDGSLDNSGNVTANDTSTVSFEGYTVTNESGATIEAAGSGTVSFDNAGITNDSGATIESLGAGAAVDFTNDQVTNLGALIANGGIMEIADAVTGSGSITIENGGTLDLGSTAPAVTFSGNNAGTLRLENPSGFAGAGQIEGLALGDIIDFPGATITSASISGSTLQVTESGGQTLDFQVAGNFSGDSFAIQSDGHDGDQLVLEPAALTIATTVISNNTVQEGQTLVASATITDSADQNDTVNYQWQSSSNGGQTWTNLAPTTTGQFNSILSSFYQLGAADEGNIVRAVASFTDASGQLNTAVSAPTAAVADVTPILTVPFSYAVDSFDIVKGGTTFSDNFSNGPPPVGGLFGTTQDAFSTTGGSGGSIWTEVGGKAIMSSSGAAANGINDSVQALLITNTSPEGTGSGQSNSGLKANATFTVSGTFDLAAPQPSTGYGIALTNAVSGQTNTEEVQLQVVSTSSGGANVVLQQADIATDTFTPIANLVLTSQQLAGNTQIELDLAHNTAGTSAITGSFELFDNGTQTFTDTFSATGHAFNSQTFTRALIQTFSNDGVIITGLAPSGVPLVGSTLTANTSTNDADATINYQWEELTSSSFATFSNVGSNSSTYQVRGPDLNDYIRVVVTTSDPDNSATPASATSAVTGPVSSLQPPQVSAPTPGSTASSFVTIDDPSTLHGYAAGINNQGQIVGSAAADANHDVGWEYSGGFSTIAVAGNQDSDVTGINIEGQVAGFTSPVRSTPRYGFIDNNGSFTQLNLPPNDSTTDNGINDSGVIVGNSYLHQVGNVTPEYTGFHR